MRVIIAGGRYYHFTSSDIKALNDLHSQYAFSEVICGCAAGADIEGARWAQENGIPIKFHPAMWHVYGRSAGPVRNIEMAEKADALIAFPGTNGTDHMVETALKLKLKIWDWRA